MEDRVLLTQFSVTNLSDDENPGSLRWAIEQVNQGTGGDAITFCIQGSGSRQININSALPSITVPVTIDGTSQPGYAGTPVITLMGSGNSGGFDGLELSGGNTTVRGLAIANFGGNGIKIDGGSGYLITNNYIGVLPGGDAAGNDGDGIKVVAGSSIQIGGTLPGQGNVLSGNGGYGFEVGGISTTVTGAFVRGNRIGTDPTGTKKLGNGLGGVAVASALSLVLGGTVPGAGNVISGNSGPGLMTHGSTDGLLVEGNHIGTDVTNTLNLGNLGGGVRLVSTDNTIGGLTPGAANVIAYNGNPSNGSGAGVSLGAGVFNNAILSNSIFENQGLGINLGGTGNHQQNYPLLGAVTLGKDSTRVVGSMVGAPGATYTVQFFANDASDPSGFGEGKYYLGSQSVTIASDGHAVINATVPVTVSIGQTITATVTDPAGNTSEFARNLDTLDTPDLSVSIQATPAQISVGDTVTYQITVTNVGQSPAGNVQVTDMLPSGATIISSQAQNGSIAVGSSSLVVSFGSVFPGEVRLITIVVGTSSVTSSALTNSVVVSNLNGDNNADNNLASVVTPLGPIADLSVQVQGSSPTVAEGQNVTYTVTLTNRGPSDATGVTLTDTLPEGTTIFSAIATQGIPVVIGNVITLSLDNMSANADPVVLTVVVTTTAANFPSLVNSAAVTSASSDLTADNDTASATTQVTNLALVMTGSPDPVRVGDQLTYSVQLTNIGTTTATGIRLVDQLPDGVAFLSALDNQGGTTTLLGGTLTDIVPSLAPGATLNWQIVVRLADSAAPTLVNAVTASETSPAIPSLTASTTTAVVPVANLGLTIRPDRSTILAGQSVTYLVTVTNQGPSPATAITLSDLLPTGVILSSVTMSQGQSSLQEGTLIASFGDLASGASATMTLVLLTSESAPGFTDSATVWSHEFDTDTTDNTATATTAVTPASDLAVQVTSPTGPIQVGQSFQYSLIVTNNGPYAANNVILTGTFPAGVTLISAVDSLNHQLSLSSGGILLDSIGTLESGESVMLALTLVSPSSLVVLSNVTVASGLPDPDSTNNSAALSTNVIPSADLSVSLSADQSTVNTGQAVTYTVTATNHGPSTATGVRLSEILPQGAVFVSAGSGVVRISQAGGIVTLGLGNIAAGASTTITFVVLPGKVGQTQDRVTISANEADPSTANNTANAPLNVLESPGSFQFSAPVFSVTNTAGMAIITVTREGGARGIASIYYCSPEGGSARPGIDFMPVAGTLVFQPGQTVATFSVPILDYPYNQHDQTIALRLITPTGGASLGADTASTILVKDLNPDVVAPTVQELRIAGPASGINDVTLYFNKALDAPGAIDPSHYQVIAVGPDGRYGTGDDFRVGVQSAAYNPSNNTVDLHFASPLGANQFYYVRVVGLTDPGGLPLAGGEYDAYFGRGTLLVYPDSHGNSVTLRLNGGGVLDLTRFPNGEGNRLQVLNPVFRRTTLLGRVQGNSSTSLDAVTGLGEFGQVNVRLATPPFYVNQLPFNRTILSSPSVDTVLASGSVRLPRRALLLLARLARLH